MSDDLSTRRLAELRAALKQLEPEVRRLESQQALLEKQLEARDDVATRKRLEDVERQLGVKTAEVARIAEELEGLETAREEQQATTDELERLVDSFSSVAVQMPELAEVLSAMKLCVGALATSRRLERTHESLVEAKDISKALTEALMRLASTMATRSQVLANLKPVDRG